MLLSEMFEDTKVVIRCGKQAVIMSNQLYVALCNMACFLS